MIENIKLKIWLVSLFYSMWFFSVSFVLRTDDNKGYGYITAWCTGLWISAILQIKLKSMLISFGIFVFVYLIDGYGRYYFFTFPKQFEDFTIVVYAVVSTLPILINYAVQHCLSAYSKKINKS